MQLEEERKKRSSFIGRSEGISEFVEPRSPWEDNINMAF